jgi:hypothetical protein
VRNIILIAIALPEFSHSLDPKRICGQLIFSPRVPPYFFRCE